MPIRRWHGWAAYCPDCGKPIDLTGEGGQAFEDREHVVDQLTDNFPCVTQDEAIRLWCREQFYTACGKRTRAARKKAATDNAPPPSLPRTPRGDGEDRKTDG